MSECKGKNCNAIDGYGHSEECEKDHNAVVFFGAGNRNPDVRYSGYKGRPIKSNATEDEKAAYQEGVNAREG